MEEWRDIKGYEGAYQVSDKGRVKSLARKVVGKNGKVYPFKEVMLKAGTTKNGYKMVCLQKKEIKPYSCYVHRLEAIAFIPNSEDKGDVNHIDGVKTNNNLQNLEWMTRKENIQHSLSMGLTPSGEKCSWSRLTELDIHTIRWLGKSIPQKKIAKVFNIDNSHVSKIQSGQRWKRTN